MNITREAAHLEGAWAQASDIFTEYAGYLIELRIEQIADNGSFETYSIKEAGDSPDFAGIKMSLEENDDPMTTYIIRAKVNSAHYDASGEVRSRPPQSNAQPPQEIPSKDDTQDSDEKPNAQESTGSAWTFVKLGAVLVGCLVIGAMYGWMGVSLALGIALFVALIA